MEAKITSVQSSEESTESSQPLYESRTAAGFGVPGDDTVDDSLNLHNYLVHNETATFFVRVTGDSMEGAKIFDGDVLVVDRSRNPGDMSIVVAAVNGELLVKRLRKTTKGVELHSENKDYAPIPLTDSDDCFIWGQVVGVARKLS